MFKSNIRKKLAVCIVTLVVLYGLSIKTAYAIDYNKEVAFNLSAGSDLVYVDSAVGLPGSRIALTYWLGDSAWNYIGDSINIYDSGGTLVSSIDISGYFVHRATGNIETLNLFRMSNGNIVVYWYCPSLGYDLTDTYFFIVDPTDGSLITPETKINQLPGELNRYTQVAELSNGNLAFTWTASGTDYGLRIFNSNGTAQGNQISISSLDTDMGYVYSQDIAANDNGTFMIVYDCYNSDKYKGILFNNDGTVKTVGGVVDFDISSVYKSGSPNNYVMNLPNGNFLVFYKGEPGADYTTRDSRVAIFTPDGTRASETILKTIGNTNIGGAIRLPQGGYDLIYYDSSYAMYADEYNDNGNVQQTDKQICDARVNSWPSFALPGYDSGLATVRNPGDGTVDVRLFDFDNSSLTITAAPVLTEENLDAGSLNAELSGTNFADSILDGANFVINNAPAGLSIESITYTDNTHCTVNLAYDGTDFDSDVTNLSLTIKGAELASGSDLTSDTLSITATVETAPALTTDDVTTYTARTATAGGDVTASGGEEVTERGIVYSTSPGPTTSDSKETAAGTTGAFTADLTGLSPNTKYYVRAYAANSVGTSYGNEVNFTTEPITSTITAASALTEENLDTGSLDVELSGTTIADSSLDGANFVLNNAPAGLSVESAVYTDETHCTVNLAYDGTDFDSDVTNLSLTIKGAELTSGSDLISDTLSITATVETAPALTTDDITTYTATTATAGGNVTASGGEEVTERGIVYSTSPGPTTSDSKETAAGTTGAFTADLTGLSPNTKYYVRAYAANGVGTSYGNEVNFTTEPITSTITTAPALTEENLDAGSLDVELSGTTFADSILDGASFVLNNAPAGLSVESAVYTDETHCTVNLAYDGTDFDSDVTNLSLTIKGAELASGSDLTSDTLSITATVETAPALTTDDVTTYTATTATAGGDVTASGGEEVTERGIVYSTTPGPTTSDSKETAAGTTGAFIADLTGLSPNTKYYVRAFATNSVGTSYGNEVNFTTDEARTIATLSDLKSAGTTVAGFDSTTEVYNVVLPRGTTAVPVVTATVTDIGRATVVITPAVSLPGTTTIVVTAEDGITTKTYSINYSVATAHGGGTATPMQNTTTPAPQTTTAGNSATATTTAQVTTDSSGKATAAVTQAQVTSAVNKVIAEAAEQGTGTEAGVEIKVAASKDAKTVKTNIPQAAWNLIANSKLDRLTVSTPLASISFDDKSLAAISSGAAGDVKITAALADRSNLPQNVQKVVGNHPVFDFTVTSGGKTISNFGGGRASVSIPYTPQAGENPNKIVIYYIGDNGKLNKVPNCKYDPQTGTVNFVTSHFSTYAVGYEDISFADVSGWYADAVNYLAARDIIKGKGEAQFAPQANITRAEFVQILANLAGADLSGYKTSAFTDVQAADWFNGAVQWAYENGIAAGSDGKFAPNANITRQDMAVMISHYAEKAARYTLPKVNAAVVFADNGQIAGYAKTSVSAMQQAGIISGRGGNTFAPQANATRAEAAQMIAVLVQGMVK